jgi:hypothetical protein
VDTLIELHKECKVIMDRLENAAFTDSRCRRIVCLQQARDAAEDLIHGIRRELRDLKDPNRT